MLVSEIVCVVRRLRRALVSRIARVLRVDVHALLPAASEESRTIIDREIQSAVELSRREKEEVAKVVGGVITAGASRGTE